MIDRDKGERPHFRRNVRSRALGLALIGLTLACTPAQRIDANYPIIPLTPTIPLPLSPEVQAEIEKTEREKAIARAKRPDCYVDDVDHELQELAAGRDTYNPRQIRGGPEVREAILSIRQVKRDTLQKTAKVIINANLARQDRSIMLSIQYTSIAEIEVGAIGKFTDEFSEELIHSANCSLTKVTSLISDDIIEDLKAGRGRIDLPPRLPSSQPI